MDAPAGDGIAGAPPSQDALPLPASIAVGAVASVWTMGAPALPEGMFEASARRTCLGGGHLDVRHTVARCGATGIGSPVVGGSTAHTYSHRQRCEGEPILAGWHVRLMWQPARK